MYTQKTPKNKGRFLSALDRHAMAGAKVWPSAHSTSESGRVRIAARDLAEKRPRAVVATFRPIALGFVLIRPCPLHKKKGGDYYKEGAGPSFKFTLPRRSPRQLRRRRSDWRQPRSTRAKSANRGGRATRCADEWNL